MIAILSIVIIPVIFALFILNQGAAISGIWNMLMPQHFGLTEISISAGIALSCLASIIKPNMRKVDQEKDTAKAVGVIVRGFILPWFLYFIAWVAVGL